MTLLLIVSVYSFYKVSTRNKQKWHKKACWKKCYKWGIDIRRRKGCYLPFIAHTFDQATDIGVIISFYELRNKTEEECGGANMRTYLILSILSLCVYRFISAILIASKVKPIKGIKAAIFRFMSQIFDLELYRAIWVNHSIDNVSPCNPQRYITLLEASFESAPQALIQLSFLIKTQTFDSGQQMTWNRFVIIISTFLSIYHITTKVIRDDKILFQSHAQTLNANCRNCKNCTDCVSWTYLQRYLFRILDISSRILLLTFLWIGINGFAITIVICVELISLIIIGFMLKDSDILFWIIGLPFGRNSLTAITFWCYRIYSNILLLIAISLFLSGPVYCRSCSDWNIRNKLVLHNPLMIGLYIYTIISLIIVCLWWFVVMINGISAQNVSKNRSFAAMKKANDMHGIKEWECFVGGEANYVDDDEDNADDANSIKYVNNSEIKYVNGKATKYVNGKIENTNQFGFPTKN